MSTHRHMTFCEKRLTPQNIFHAWGYLGRAATARLHNVMQVLHQRFNTLRRLKVLKHSHSRRTQPTSRPPSVTELDVLHVSALVLAKTIVGEIQYLKLSSLPHHSATTIVERDIM